MSTATTLGTKIDDLHAKRELKRELEKQVAAISKEMDDIENLLIDQMDQEGVTKSTGSVATVAISTSIKPSVDNWDDFYKFIHRFKYYHLLERRPAVNGCRELLETKGKIPGVVPYTHRKLNIRSV